MIGRRKPERCWIERARGGLIALELFISIVAPFQFETNQNLLSETRIQRPRIAYFLEDEIEDETKRILLKSAK